MTMRHIFVITHCSSAVCFYFTLRNYMDLIRKVFLRIYIPTFIYICMYTSSVRHCLHCFAAPTISLVTSVVCFQQWSSNESLTPSGHPPHQPHVLFFVMQGAQMYARIIPPPKTRAIIAKVVHVAELEVTRVGTSLFIAGNSATSSVAKPHLLALAIRDLRRRDAFSQDLLDVRFDKPSKQFPKCPIISRRVSFLSQSKCCDKFRTAIDRNCREVCPSNRAAGARKPTCESCLTRSMLYHDPRHFRKSRGDIISSEIRTALSTYAVLRLEEDRISSDKLALYSDW